MKIFLIIFLELILSLTLKGQSISNDSLINSLEVIFEKIDSNYKEQHFISSESYDYYNSINSPKIAYEFNNALSKIEFPVTTEQLQEITFVKCHNWVEAYSTWYITIVDKMNNYYIYFYEDNKGTQSIDLYTVKQGKDYFYSLAKNLLSNLICGEKNEDYLIMGKVVNERFVLYSSSQIFHRIDMVFFNDLLGALHSR